MQVEKQLAELALNGKYFRVMLPKDGIHTPIYIIDPTSITEGTIVAHIVSLPKGPALVISRVLQACYDTDDHLAARWPSHLVTEPILHSWDKRKLEELTAPRFHLVLNTVQCVLKRDDDD